MSPPEHPTTAPGAAIDPRVGARTPSATLAINEHCAALEAAGREVLRLGLGQSPFPIPGPVVQALRTHAAAKDYLPVRGLPLLRRAVCDYLRRTQGLHYVAHNILIGPGTKELIFLLQLVHDAELVLPSPSWVSYAPQAEIVGRAVQWLPTDAESGYALSAETLDAHCREQPARPRLLILNHPCNPTGAVYSPDQLEALAGVARRHGMLVLSDEIYSGTRFDGHHRSLACHYPEGTVISDGLSKWCGAGGWRLGFLALPEPLASLGDAMAAVASETFTAVSAPVQLAAATAFQGGRWLDAYLTDSQRILAALAGLCRDRLTAAGAACPPARGGFYLFVDCERHRRRLAHRGIHDGQGLCARLLADTGVALLPGEAFGRPPAELSARLAYVDFDGTAALEAAAATPVIDEGFLRRYCPRVVTAAERMANWLSP